MFFFLSCCAGRSNNNNERFELVMIMIIPRSIIKLLENIDFYPTDSIGYDILNNYYSSENKICVQLVQ